MTLWTEQAIFFGKAIIFQFHQRNEEESQDDGEYIANLKMVIHGAIATAPDPLSKRQVQQTLQTMPGIFTSSSGVMTIRLMTTPGWKKPWTLSICSTNTKAGQNNALIS
ncbi:hypothetical protein [Endozoicomonas sp. SCSIO W0465]|uniref:hypothetical protein n=1 Tax=Endozoicomonas sp. SCSIO W0465 TaxID=2918516 RepID=UPI0020752E13|nr:hypothetical protein [Endozoicomonas sp. SCSIO W0465]USE35541.1 hypothetical protein MJO57_26190 [Endozoicomonas sp. SCSIO W0465]